jgi:hypothetical protein
VVDNSTIDMGSYYTHHIEITGLDAETSYQILVGNGTMYFRASEDGQYTVSTTKTLDNITSPIPAYGSIYDAQEQDYAFEDLPSLTDGIVYANYYDEFADEKSSDSI